MWCKEKKTNKIPTKQKTTKNASLVRCNEFEQPKTNKNEGMTNLILQSKVTTLIYKAQTGLNLKVVFAIEIQ